MECTHILCASMYVCVFCVCARMCEHVARRHSIRHNFVKSVYTANNFGCITRRMGDKLLKQNFKSFRNYNVRASSEKWSECKIFDKWHRCEHFISDSTVLGSTNWIGLPSLSSAHMTKYIRRSFCQNWMSLFGTIFGINLSLMRGWQMEILLKRKVIYWRWHVKCGY